MKDGPYSWTHNTVLGPLPVCLELVHGRLRLIAKLPIRPPARKRVAKVEEMALGITDILASVPLAQRRCGVVGVMDRPSEESGVRCLYFRSRQFPCCLPAQLPMDVIGMV